MRYSTYTFGIEDFGPNHGKFFQLKLEVEDNGAEQLFIKYPRSEFYPLAVVNVDNYMYMWAAHVGLYGDIKMKKDKWLHALKCLHSRVKYDEWLAKIEKMESIASVC